MANMITVKVGSNLDRKTIMVQDDTTIRKVLEDNDVNYGTAQVHIDGSVLGPGDMDKTFAQVGITTSCFLVAVVKTSNAVSIQVTSRK